MEFKSKFFNYHQDSQTYTAEASTLELPPGAVPTKVVMRFPTGVCRVFAFKYGETHEGEITGWRYTGEDGRDLLIIND